MGPAETPNTPQPRPQRREREEAGSPAPGAKGGTRAGSKGKVRNPVGDSGLADAPIGVSLNMRAHEELNSQDSHRGATRALSEASSQENRIKANPKSRKNSSDH